MIIQGTFPVSALPYTLSRRTIASDANKKIFTYHPPISVIKKELLLLSHIYSRSRQSLRSLLPLSKSGLGHNIPRTHSQKLLNTTSEGHERRCTLKLNPPLLGRAQVFEGKLGWWSAA